MKIYFDVCSLCRPFDDLSQDRMYVESEAVLTIIKMCKTFNWTFASSEVINMELMKMSDKEKLLNVMTMCGNTNDFLEITDEIRRQAQEYRKSGIKFYDSIHLASAETNDYDVLLTTDDDFLRLAQKINLHTQVKNPAEWLMEII
jgi:predicted nucleic acid-binding protein